MRRRTAIIGLVLLGVAGLAALPLWTMFGDDVHEYFNRVPFDSATWKDGQDAVRLRMVDDLLRRHQLVGMPRADIDELLGAPPKTGYFRDYDYVYWLGRERGWVSIDSEWLVIRFEQGKVAEARAVRD